MLYGTITDYCTDESCPVMNAGPKYEYHWADSKVSKKALRLSAPKYIDYLMTWIQNQLDDESIFPSKIGIYFYSSFKNSIYLFKFKGHPFPKDFKDIIKTIFKRLFRVYAHIYHSHFNIITQELGEEAHLNTSFKHFIYFVKEFNLVDRKELQPLSELIESLMQRDISRNEEK